MGHDGDEGDKEGEDEQGGVEDNRDGDEEHEVLEDDDDMAEVVEVGGDEEDGGEEEGGREDDDGEMGEAGGEEDKDEGEDDNGDDEEGDTVSKGGLEEYSSDDDEEDGNKNESNKWKPKPKENETDKKIRKFWAKRWLVEYGREWQTYSKTYIRELVKQVQGYAGHSYSKVHKHHFDRIGSSTTHIAGRNEESISKYLHLKSSDNDLALSIQSYLHIGFDSGAIYVSLKHINAIYL